MSQHHGRTAVVVDHHPLWVAGVQRVVEELGIQVAGTATSGREGLALVTELRPDVLITGIMMARGDLDGIEVVARGMENVPTMKAIVLSLYDDTEHIDAALEAGAVAYVIKTAHPDDLRSAIRQAFAHSVYLYGNRAAASPVATPRAAAEGAELTRRELEILQLVAEGHSNTQLAKMLWVTEQTIKFHLSNVYRKLKVANRTEASRWAQLNGLLATSTTGNLDASWASADREAATDSSVVVLSVAR
jgi:DNA-binding NarL/FixJ family response regulator